MFYTWPAPSENVLKLFCFFLCAFPFWYVFFRILFKSFHSIIFTHEFEIFVKWMKNPTNRLFEAMTIPCFSCGRILCLWLNYTFIPRSFARVCLLCDYIFFVNEFRKRNRKRMFVYINKWPKCWIGLNLQTKEISWHAVCSKEFSTRPLPKKKICFLFLTYIYSKKVVLVPPNQWREH